MTMTTDIHSHHKALLKPLRDALYHYEPEQVRATLAKVFAADATIHLCFPFETLQGPMALYDEVFVPLQTAIPDLERRDTIVMGA